MSEHGGAWRPGGPPPSGPDPRRAAQLESASEQGPALRTPGYPGGPFPTGGSWGGGTPYGRVPPLPDYAPWLHRVGSSLIDFLPGLIGSAVFLVGYGMVLVAGLSSSDPGLDLGVGAVPLIAGGALTLLGLGWTIHNRWLVGGRTGQSLGKRILDIRLIGEHTGAPLGPANAFTRDLVHILDGLTCVGCLWPLWDHRRQTLSDKLMRSVVVTVPPAGHGGP